MSYWMAVRRRLAAIALAGINVAALAIAYTGNMTDEIVTMGDGNDYRLLTLTSSGTLNIPKEVNADIWMCGGGANGERAWTGGPAGGYGGSGGFIATIYSQKIKDIIAVVGAAAGNSSISGDISLSASCGVATNTYSSATTEICGASGGGGRGTYYWDSIQSGLKGSGSSTYPFGDSDYFSGKPHCAGGGGGTCSHYASGTRYTGAGGKGGTNGGNGGNGLTAGGSGNSGGTGGTLGGGNGASYRLGNRGTNATFYGSGGGGGSISDDEDDVSSTYNPTSGYQGVIYVRIPLNQAA